MIKPRQRGDESHEPDQGRAQPTGSEDATPHVLLDPARDQVAEYPAQGAEGDDREPVGEAHP